VIRGPRSKIAFDGPKTFSEEAYVPSNADPEAVKLAIHDEMRVIIPGRTLPAMCMAYPWSLLTLNKPARSRQIPPPLSSEELEEVARTKKAAASWNLNRQLR
jgi:hypothetical protein